MVKSNNLYEWNVSCRLQKFYLQMSLLITTLGIINYVESIETLRRIINYVASIETLHRIINYDSQGY